MTRRRKPARAPAAHKVLVVAEGASELGDLAKEPSFRGDPPRDGYLQPMLRRLLGGEWEFEGQRITLLGRFSDKKRLKGHADRAAKALALAATLDGCRLVVFAHDVDKGSGEKRGSAERRRRVAEMHADIETGFAAVSHADHVLRVKATPLRMLEAWALGDREAIRAVAGRDGDASAVPDHPEETWGDEKDSSSRHPKSLLRRALGREPAPDDFARLAENARVDVLCETCPASFAPFAREADAAREAVREASRRDK